MDSNIRRYKRTVKKINALSGQFESLRDEDLAPKASLLRMRAKSGEDLDKILPEAYALVREAAKRTRSLWAFDVQLMGAIAAHEGKITEMKTGEGKTLTIIFPAFLGALEQKGVHVVTANDYLAQRDAQWTKPVYDILGLSVSSVTSKSNDFDRQVAYHSDITYVTNNEVGFDYLKDNMLYEEQNKRQRGLHFAIIDEADSVLIDEAQTPLVISDSSETDKSDKEMFNKLNKAVVRLEKNKDFKVDEKSQTVFLTLTGSGKLERMLNVANLYGDNEVDYLYYIERLLKAHHLFKKDKDYIVENGKVVIVDEFTGRLMPSHRYFQGIHQAIEAKEGMDIGGDTKTLASVTFQNFFKLYNKFSGLTGTAATAEKEFRAIYKKEVAVIPTNKKVIRKDLPDRFFLTWNDKIKYLTWNTQEYFFKKRAVLIGTRSVDKSNQIQQALIGENIPSNVLNAKHTKREAEVIARAGISESVTVATNMAGRGTDIKLDETVKKTGGLAVAGTERHNARRIDNQLIGRSGRQGDPGQSQFLISADDELIRVYYREKYEKQIKKYRDFETGVEDKKMQAILSRAQKRFEDQFFNQRAITFEFDKVLDMQRESFYINRKRVLGDNSLKQETLVLIKHEIYQMLLRIKSGKKVIISGSEVKMAADEIKKWVDNNWLRFKFSLDNSYTFSDALENLFVCVKDYYQDFENYYTSGKLRNVEKVTTLKVLDLLWVEHLKETERLQDAALVSSISRSDYFENYEIQMTRAYHNMMKSVPRVICRTIFRTINRLWNG